MDDFGTGYASISILRHIVVERIKLEQSYIKQIESDIEQALIKTVIWMARVLDVELVAEGIEKEDQLKVLTALGCKPGQSFLFN
ncbi:EAL domain-containing protein [Parasynechococcus sp.]|uniref:EAL domain-containing protein n=1 Tax=Parasynechococcus sp. TaxID=3101203 RepID=UPI0037044DA7